MNSPLDKNNHRLRLEDNTTWRCPDILVLTEELRNDFNRKKQAIDDYLQGRSVIEITQKTGISRQYINYLYKRCTQISSDGGVVGYFGLLKGKQVVRRNEKIAKLNSGSALPGSLKALFLKFPELHEAMRKVILEGIVPGSRKSNKRLTWPQIHNIFLDLCTAEGINPPFYPFCSDSEGLFALTRWGKRLVAHDSSSTHFTYDETRHPPSRCFERVEVDGHFIDVNWTLEVPSLNGDGVIHCKIARLWLVAILEWVSTAVLGYSICLGRNYGASDVANAVRSSLVPWKPRKLTVSTVAYRPGECLPNALLPELGYLCFDELWLDNAKSHLSDIFLTVLEQGVNAVPVFGPKASPNVRPKVEGLFDLLEEAGIHCMEGTTGANPQDTRKAKKANDPFILPLEAVLDLVDLLIVRYNTGICPGTTISRNEVLVKAVQRETTLFRYVPLAKRQDCLEFTIFDQVTIGEDRGKPVVRWKNARYYGPGLSLNLIGQEILIKSKEDVRELEAVLINDGMPLGKLKVEKRWSHTPHSLSTRATIRRYMTNNSFLKKAADLPLAFRQWVEMEQNSKSKSHRLLARLHREQEQKLESDVLVPENLISSFDELLETTGQFNEFEDDVELDDQIRKLGTSYR